MRHGLRWPPGPATVIHRGLDQVQGRGHRTAQSRVLPEGVIRILGLSHGDPMSGADIAGSSNRAEQLDGQVQVVAILGRRPAVLQTSAIGALLVARVHRR